MVRGHLGIGFSGAVGRQKIPLESVGLHFRI